MPDGVVGWLESSTGRAGIVRGGAAYGARQVDMEPAARHVGARVHFDIRRIDGADSAVEVRLRRGTRNHPYHHRVGTLAGAHDRGSGAVARFTGRHAGYRADLELHPLQVVSAWAQQVAAGDIDGSLALYSPDAVVHLDHVTLVSPRHIRRRIETLPVFASGRLPAVRGDQDSVLARWEPLDLKELPLEARSRVGNGLIVEQWVAPAATGGPVSALDTGFGPVPLTVTTQGDVAAEALRYAVRRVAQVVERVDDPILAVHIKLSEAADPARSLPSLGQVSLDIDGQIVRAHVAAHEMHEAVDLLARRLADRLEHRSERTEALRRRGPGHPQPGEWSHGDLPTARPEFFDRPAEERRLVRHKPFFAAEQTVDEAIFDMDLLDYDFYLFCDLGSGQDSVVERLGESAYRLHQLRPGAGVVVPSAHAMEVDTRPAPVLAVTEAVGRLGASGARFVFFAGRDSGRGCVVYRRYDGHYGLITLE